jgi:hypothetical protein
VDRETAKRSAAPAGSSPAHSQVGTLRSPGVDPYAGHFVSITGPEGHIFRSRIDVLLQLQAGFKDLRDRATGEPYLQMMLNVIDIPRMIRCPMQILASTVM